MLFELSDREFFFDPFSMHFFASPSNAIPTLTPDDLAPAYVSRLLHEVTHLDCMRTDLGVGLVMGMLWLQKRILSTSASDPVLTSDGQTIPDPRTGTAMLLQPLLVTKILPRFASAVPVLEGLAMFAQLDLRFSSEEVSSLQFRASLSLLAQASGQTGAQSLVAQFHDRVRQHVILEEHLLHRLLYGVDRRNSYYLFGYIFVKSLAYILRQKEPRFHDPEMAYLFLRAFLLNGGDYVHEGVLGPGGVSEQLQRRLDQLLSCPRELLRVVYDVIAEDTTDQLTDIDWAHFIESGTLRNATDEPLLRTTLDQLGIDHDDLMRMVVSMDFVPLKMVMGRIAFAKIDGDHVLIVIASGVGERGAVCNKWLTRDDFALIEQQGRQNGKLIPIVEDLPAPERAFEAIGDPSRVSVLWTSAFSAEKLMPIRLWSFPEAVFSDDDGTLRRLREDATTYLNFFERRRFADFIFDVIGPRLPGARLMLWDFCHFVFSRLMKVEGGRKFDLLLQHGFSIMSVDSYEPLSAAARGNSTASFNIPYSTDWGFAMNNDATPIRIEDYFTSYAANASDLLGTLKVTRIPGTTSVTLTSRKWKNCILNWKKFLFDVLPVTVGVVTTIPSNAAAAAIVSLQAFKSAVDALQIELPREAGELVLRIAKLQRDAEDGGRGPWIPVADLFLLGADSAEGGLVVVLRDLERLGVVRLDLEDQKVRVVEEIRFVEA